MKSDDLICYCYHVPLGKLVNFARRLRPRRASQMSQCLGAGTGCGWCIPILTRIHARSTQEPMTENQGPDDMSPNNTDERSAHDTANAVLSEALVAMTPQEYAAARQQYRQSGEPKNTF